MVVHPLVVLARPCREIDRVVLDARDPTAQKDKMIIVRDADAGSSNCKRSNPIFILDSGASHHIASDGSLFHGPLDDAAAAKSHPAAIRGIDGTALPIAGAGTVQVSEKFYLPDVLFVPGLQPGKILVSVAKLTTLGYEVQFGGGQCRVMNRTGDKPVGQGPLQRDDGFYYRLDFLKIPPDDEAAADGTDSK